MAERTEEKYLLDMSEYSAISARIRAVMAADSNGKDGGYSISSLYFDDPHDTALREKEDGDAVHVKYRVRTYNGEAGYIRLERKIKKGLITEKKSAKISERELASILSGEGLPEGSAAFGLFSEMRSRLFLPVVTVRYDREAYVYPSLGVRVTFDKNVDRLPPDAHCLFGNSDGALPAIERGHVIMEIKYSGRCPSFIRKCMGAGCTQLSVSKYALARRV